MTEKMRLDLKVLLPDVSDEADACATRLADALEGRNGIGQVHVRRGQDGSPTQLCIHYDAASLSLEVVDPVVGTSRQTAQRISPVSYTPSSSPRGLAALPPVISPLHAVGRTPTRRRSV